VCGYWAARKEFKKIVRFNLLEIVEFSESTFST